MRTVLFWITAILVAAAVARAPREIQTSDPSIQAFLSPEEEEFDEGEEVDMNSKGYDLYAKGIALLKDGKDEEAIEKFKACIDASPALDVLAEAHRRIGNWMMQQKKGQEAFDSFMESIKAKPSSSNHRDAATLLLMSGNYTTGLVFAYHAVKMDRENVGAHLIMGHLMSRVNRTSAAIDAFATAATLVPGHQEALTALAELHLAGRNYSAAEMHLRSAVQHHPNSASAHYNLGNFLRQTYRYEEAVSYFTTALLVDRNYTDALLGLAGAYTSLGRIQHVVVSLEMTLEEVKEVDRLVKHALGVAYLQINSFGKAVKTFVEVSTADPAMHPAIFNIATVYEDLGFLDTAVAAYEAAAHLAPNNTLYASSLQSAQTTLQFSSGPPDEVFRVAAALAASGDRTQRDIGLVLLMHLARTHPKNATFQAAAGQVHLARDLVDAASEAFETALKLDPHLEIALAGVGEMHMRRHAWGKAAKAFSTAAEAHTGLSRAEDLVRAAVAHLRAKEPCDRIESALRGAEDAHPTLGAAVVAALARVFEGCAMEIGMGPAEMSAAFEKGLAAPLPEDAAAEEKLAHTQARRQVLFVQRFVTTEDIASLPLPDAITVKLLRQAYGGTEEAPPPGMHAPSHIFHNITGKLRIGVVTAMGERIVDDLVEFLPHRPDGVEIFVYALDHSPANATWTQGLNETFDHFTLISSLRSGCSEEQSRWVTGDRLSALIALDTAPRTLAVLAAAPAPVQAVYGMPHVLPHLAPYVTHVIGDSLSLGTCPEKKRMLVPHAHALTSSVPWKWASAKAASAADARAAEQARARGALDIGKGKRVVAVLTPVAHLPDDQASLLLAPLRALSDAVLVTTERNAPILRKLATAIDVDPGRIMAGAKGDEDFVSIHAADVVVGTAVTSGHLAAMSLWAAVPYLPWIHDVTGRAVVDTCGCYASAADASAFAARLGDLLSGDPKVADCIVGARGRVFQPDAQMVFLADAVRVAYEEAFATFEGEVAKADRKAAEVRRARQAEAAEAGSATDPEVVAMRAALAHAMGDAAARQAAEDAEKAAKDALAGEKDEL